MKFLIFIILLASLSIGFQNCAAENFTADGNGQPYEGLTPHTLPDDDFDFDPPIFEDEDDLDAEIIDSNEEAKDFQTVFLCKKWRLRSRHFVQIKFGYKKNGKAIIVIKRKNGKFIKRPWNEAARNHSFYNKRIGDGYILKRLLFSKNFAENGRLSVKIRDSEGEPAHERFICD